MTADQVSKFMIYLKQLKEWNKTTNLTSIVKDEEVVIKHFIDSIAAIKAENFIDGSLIFDIGSGAGFPGIPIKPSSRRTAWRRAAGHPNSHDAGRRTGNHSPRRRR
ncbi:MAG: hypothetical protein CAF44_006850 [Nitrospira sp. CG24D]|nr:MAG: hypothetical protein CAF44_006850 [Nitrospira sp. CG24D]